MLRTVLLVVVVLMLLGSLPLFSFNSGWGYYPAGGFSILLVVILLFAFRGRSRV